MVAFCLIGIELSERSNRLIEHVSAAQVAADHCGIARAGMGTRERSSTEFSILDEAPFDQGRDIHRQLHVAQLANVEVDRA